MTINESIAILSICMRGISTAVFVGAACFIAIVYYRHRADKK
jgi:hypothetical protein